MRVNVYFECLNSTELDERKQIRAFFFESKAKIREKIEMKGKRKFVSQSPITRAKKGGLSSSTQQSDPSPQNIETFVYR